MDDDPWTCRRCGAALEDHDHSSWLGTFFCRGSHLQQEFLGQDESEPSVQPVAESTMRGTTVPVTCPFCGSPHGHIVQDPATAALQVECPNCGARSPRYNEKDAALAAWSRRAL